MIRNGDSFDENTTIYIDGFDSFSGAQQNFLRALADKGVNFVVALCTDENKAEVFATCDRTERLFERGNREDINIPVFAARLPVTKTAISRHCVTFTDGGKG